MCLFVESALPRVLQKCNRNKVTVDPRRPRPPSAAAHLVAWPQKLIALKLSLAIATTLLLYGVCLSLLIDGGHFISCFRCCCC